MGMHCSKWQAEPFCCAKRRPERTDSSFLANGGTQENLDLEIAEPKLTRDNSTERNFRLQGQREAIFGGGGEDDVYLEIRNTKKTKQEIEFIDNCVKEKTIFYGLNKNDREAIIDQMYRMDVKKGTKLIKEGDEDADDFYVVYEGSFDILIADKKVAVTKAGQCVGELALIHNAPRAATVQATEDSKLFGVHRAAFRVAMRKEKNKGRTMMQKMLSNIPEFSVMSLKSIQTIIDAFEEQTFKEGEVIIEQGSNVKNFYLIRTGACTWKRVTPEEKWEEGHLGQLDYFGDMALLSEASCDATVTTITPVTTWVLNKKELLGMIGSTTLSERKNKKEPIEIIGSSTVSNHRRKFKPDWTSELIKPVCKIETLLRSTIGVLGKGAFGIVTLVKDPSTNQTFALKSIEKYQIVKARRQKHVLNERRIMSKLSNLHCKFLVKLINTYKDRYKVYFLLEVCLGGELFTILRKKRAFNENTTRFYIACVIEAFQCMHAHNIIYRDLKPENLVLDWEGYPKITDFGFAKEVRSKTYTMCGTPDYLAPEILQGLGHDKAVDWWTLGILTFEMVNSMPPFYSRKKMNTYRKILLGSVRWPRKFSEELKSFIQSLLTLRPVARLGMQHNASRLIESKSFFRGFNWMELRARKMKAPIINQINSLEDMSNFRHVKIKPTKLRPISKKREFDQEF